MLMLYNFLPSHFQAKQEHDFKIKDPEHRAGGEEDSGIYSGYTYVAPVNTDIFFLVFSWIGKWSWTSVERKEVRGESVVF